ncbi:sporulation protein YjcZ [Paenibacillus sp. 2TAB19]|jgi:uncharacterized membrane protein YhiD involved in acid resistance
MGYPVAGVGAGCGNGLWSNTGTILVLFILLVIILRAVVF